MADRAKLVGLAAIDRAIRTFKGNIVNTNERVQEILVAIVEHAAGAGNGDVSRALTICQVIKSSRTMNAAYAVGWFAAFAGTNVNLAKGTVNLFSKDSKKQRGFRVDEARANNWFDAVDANGERAPWYAGPTPEDFQSEGIGDIATRIERFVKRMNDSLDGTKTVKGKEVPLVKLSDADREQVHNALELMARTAATLARHERIQALREQVANEEGAKDEVIEELLTAPMEKAVA